MGINVWYSFLMLVKEFLQLSPGRVRSEESQSLFRNQWFGLLFFQFFLAFCIIGTMMGLGYYFLEENSPTTQGNKMLYKTTQSSRMSVVTDFFWLYNFFFHLTPHFFHLDPLPCLSPACMRVAERFSTVMDPFSRPCDYFLFSCKAEISPKSRGRQRGNTISYNGTRRDEMTRRVGKGGAMRKDRGSDTERKRGDRLPDRQVALLQAIKEILGRTQNFLLIFLSLSTDESCKVVL